MKLFGTWITLAMVCFLPAVALAHLQLVPDKEPQRVFAGEVRQIAIVWHYGTDVLVSTPLYVRICDDKHGSSLVTFSGQEIQVAGQTVTVLADARGGIILTGNKFVWSNTERTYAGKHLKIEDKNLGPATM
jgi:hypothetical protein